MRTLMLLLLLLLVLPAGLLAGADAAAQTAVAVELALVGAGPDGVPLRVDADVDGPAVLWSPYSRYDTQLGWLRFSEAQGTLKLTDGELAGRLRASVQGASASRGRSADDIAVDVGIRAAIEGDVIRGTWTMGDRTGPVHGFRRDVPTTGTLAVGSVTLENAYPWPGREGTMGYSGLQARLGASFELKDGRVVKGTTGPTRPRASWFPSQSFRPATWVLPDGRSVIYATHGYGHTDSSVTGSVAEDRLTLEMVARIERQPEPVTWRVELRRVGTLWFGTWTWTVTEGVKEMTGFAAGRVSRAATPPLPRPSGDGARQVLLRHAIALAEHPGNVIWRDDLLAMAALGTGNKQYDNAPNNVAGAIYSGLLLHRLSDDPLVRAEGMAMARRAAAWWHISRFGPLRVAEYYKGMFWVTAWSGFALADLAAADDAPGTPGIPGSPWKQWSGELAASIEKAQLPSGAWTWVDEETGKRGTSNERGNRAFDDRELNCGDLLLAMSQLAKVSGKDLGEAEQRAADWLAAKMKDPPDWHFLDRRPGEAPEPLGALCWLEWLVHQPELDAARIATARARIDATFLMPETGLLRGYVPRGTPNDSFAAVDLSASARYAAALVTLGRRGDADAGVRGKAMAMKILAQASPASGLIDHAGRDLPADAVELGQADAHAYLCLKASLAWNLLAALEPAPAPAPAPADMQP